MNRVAIVGMIGLLSACSTPRTKWAEVEPGQPKNQAIEIMGQPEEFMKDGGQDILVWRMDAFEKCAILLSRDGRVEGKRCKDDPEARSRAAAAEMQTMQSMNMQRQSQAPVQAYQAPRSTQSNCTTRWVGGTAQSDCTTTPTGIDTSIYR